MSGLCRMRALVGVSFRVVLVLNGTDFSSWQSSGGPQVRFIQLHGFCCVETRLVKEKDRLDHHASRGSRGGPF